jgi:hypothetical protein
LDDSDVGDDIIYFTRRYLNRFHMKSKIDEIPIQIIIILLLRQMSNFLWKVITKFVLSYYECMRFGFRILFIILLGLPRSLDNYANSFSIKIRIRFFPSFDEYSLHSYL